MRHGAYQVERYRVVHELVITADVLYLHRIHSADVPYPAGLRHLQFSGQGIQVDRYTVNEYRRRGFHENAAYQQFAGSRIDRCKVTGYAVSAYAACLKIKHAVNEDQLPGLRKDEVFAGKAVQVTVKLDYGPDGVTVQGKPERLYVLYILCPVFHALDLHVVQHPVFTGGKPLTAKPESYVPTVVVDQEFSFFHIYIISTGIEVPASLVIRIVYLSPYFLAVKREIRLVNSGIPRVHAYEIERQPDHAGRYIRKGLLGPVIRVEYRGNIVPAQGH